ncbi:Ran binding protein 1 [Macrophomina phaseolina MS6]|uniref:Ran binding protein 1 n=1 Tax=Macrophomina phaseolina (strain MS6) TaxID=1126212 RepID=K2S072_MACPH|nr:Ran binding protein 1 [Macrophomina phaseolina MS6]
MARSEQVPDSGVTSLENTAPEITAADRVASSGSLKSLGQASDTEGAERPVREKLKQTKIGAGQVLSDDDHEMSGASDTSKGPAENNETTEEPRGRLKKKRSFEVMTGDEGHGAAVEKQGRKRSRGPASNIEPIVTKRKTSGEKETIDENGTIKERSVTPSSSAERTRRGMLSPKGKRNREEFEDEDDKPSAEIKETTETEQGAADKKSADEPKTKRHRDSNSPEPQNEKVDEAKPTGTKIPQGSGFANTSATSPFAALAASKSPTPTASQPQTSDSAFKASGFGALASSSTSGFGSLAAASQPASSPFGSATATAKPSITGISNSTPSAFGGLSSPSESKSPFAAASSGFGSLGGSFGGGFGSGAKLTGFGGGSGPKITGLSDKPAKPFGAPKDDKDEEEGSGDDANDEDKVLSPTNEEDKKDERFYEQDVETGEENEEVIFVCRAKLYNFVKVSESKKEWKERGLGNLKVNVQKQTPEEIEMKAPKKARFVMRADGSHRVVLNSPIQKELKVGDVKGDKPTSGLILFMGTIDGNELEMLQLKMKQQNAEALWEKVTAIQKDM